MIRIFLDFGIKAESKFRVACTGVSFSRLSDLTQVSAWSGAMQNMPCLIPEIMLLPNRNRFYNKKGRGVHVE